eukprot:ANDGO_02786.mRNA.1 Conserved oligomeric Golgi complex subunit 6
MASVVDQAVHNEVSPPLSPTPGAQSDVSFASELTSPFPSSFSYSQSSSGVNAILSRKVEKTAALHVADEGLRDALLFLSDHITSSKSQSNAAVSSLDWATLRHQLRPLVDETVLATHAQFLSSLQGLVEHHRSVVREVQALDSSCKKIKSHLAQTVATTSVVVSKASDLTARKATVDQRLRTVERFLSSYMLSETDSHALLRSSAIDATFFEAFARLQVLREQAIGLMQRASHHRAALDVVERLAQIHESAMKRLFRWTKDTCRNVSDDVSDMPSLLPAALAALSRTEASDATYAKDGSGKDDAAKAKQENDLPVLLRSCVEELAGRLQTVVLSEFLEALSTGGRGRGVPIEGHVHDTVRYVGDMCAWMHQEVVLLRDLCAALFSRLGTAPAAGNVNEKPAAATARLTAEQKNEAKRLEAVAQNVVLRDAFSAVARQLRTRLVQIADAHPSLSVLFRLSNVLAFYFVTIQKLIGFSRVGAAAHGGAATAAAVKTPAMDSPEGSSPLVDALRESHEAVQRVILDTVRVHAERMMVTPPTVPADLSPPHVISDTVAKLAEFLKAQESTLVGSAPASRSSLPRSSTAAAAVAITDQAGECDSGSDVLGSSAPLVAAIVDPLIHVALSCAEEQLDRIDAPVFLINCFAILFDELDTHSFTLQKAAQIRLHLDEQMQLLIHRQSELIFHQCGLDNPFSNTAAAASSSSSSSSSSSGNLNGLAVLTTSVDGQADGAAPPSADLGIDWDVLSRKVRSFYSSLFSLGALAIPRCDKIQKPTYRSEARAGIASTVAKMYRELYASVVALDETRAREVLYHSPQQVSQLLSV